MIAAPGGSRPRGGLVVEQVLFDTNAPLNSRSVLPALEWLTRDTMRTVAASYTLQHGKRSRRRKEVEA